LNYVLADGQTWEVGICKLPLVIYFFIVFNKYTLNYVFIIGLSLQLLKQSVLPRVHGLALKTTVAAVCLYDLFQ
jgi:hypothetical protein